MKAIALAPTAGCLAAGRAPRGPQIKPNGRVALAATNLPACPAILPKATGAINTGKLAILLPEGLPSGDIAPSVLAMAAVTTVRAASLATTVPIATGHAKGLVQILLLLRAEMQGIIHMRAVVLVIPPRLRIL